MTCKQNQQPVEFCQFADEAAKKAVRDTFAILGVDIDNPVQVAEFQDDLRFGRKIRRRFEQGIGSAFLVVLGMIGAAFIAGLSYGQH
jgi:hypothetical protein